MSLCSSVRSLASGLLDFEGLKLALCCDLKMNVLFYLFFESAGTSATRKHREVALWAAGRHRLFKVNNNLYSTTILPDGAWKGQPPLTTLQIDHPWTYYIIIVTMPNRERQTTLLI